MNIVEITPQYKAIDLAQTLADLLGQEVPITPVASGNNFFLFDSDKGVVKCSTATLEEIDAIETADAKHLVPYEVIIESMERETDISSLHAASSILYSVFACLHEFGHYFFWLNTPKNVFDSLCREHCARLDDINNKIESAADDGQPLEKMLLRWHATQYRNLPLEKEADAYAIEQIIRLIREGRLK